MCASSGQDCTDILGLESFLSQAHGMIIYGPASLPTTPLRCCHTYSPYGTLVSHWDAAGSSSDGQPAPSPCHRFPPSFWQALPGEPGCLPTEEARSWRRAAEKPLGSQGSGCDVPNPGRRRSGVSIAVLGAGLLPGLPAHPPERGASGDPSQRRGARKVSAHSGQGPCAFQKKPGQWSKDELKQMLLKLSSAQEIGSKSQSPS